MKDFRIEVWTDGTHEMCSFRAEMPDSNGLRYIWFVMYRRELEGLVSGESNSAQDIMHHLTVYGDRWAFYDLEIPLGSINEGFKIEVKGYNLELPRFFAKVLYRRACQIWKQNKREKQSITISNELLARVYRLYGQGKGRVKIDADKVFNRLVEENSSDKSFVNSLERVQNIARNSTRAFWEEARVVISYSESDKDAAYWAAYSAKNKLIMNGGMIKHTDGWSIHT